MKTLATLVCLLAVTVSFAQQSPVKGESDTLQYMGAVPMLNEQELDRLNHNGQGDIDNMPILKGHGNASLMPTRNGRGNALPMPNRSTPMPLQSARVTQLPEGVLDQVVGDSLNRIKPNIDLFLKKKN
ncbi:hypothetical protein [Fibrella aquatica]|jgi:hypothetical protein|uniref:hypothetical protein n=1 Tax=Fibrella aquatica TaxID=3242487 RepID=UPI0035209A52